MATVLLDKPQVLATVVSFKPKAKIKALLKLPKVKPPAIKEKKAKKEKLVKAVKPKKDKKTYKYADQFVRRIADTIKPLSHEEHLACFRILEKSPAIQYVAAKSKFLTNEELVHCLKELDKDPISKRQVDKLMKHNQRFVADKAKVYVGKGLAYEDVFQEGNLGLLRAIVKFKRKKGFRFSTYAGIWIKEGITRALRNKSRLIRIPIQKQQMKVKVQKDWNYACTELHFRPTSTQLAHRSGYSVEQVEEFQTYDFEHKSLESAISSKRETPLSDLLADPQSPTPEVQLEWAHDSDLLNEALRQLPSHERRMIRNFYGLAGLLPRDIEQIADMFSMSKTSAKKRLAEIHDTLRNLLGNNKELFNSLG